MDDKLMSRIALVVVALFVGFGAMSAQAMLQLIVNFQNATTYAGPGDVVSGAIAWWGLRAYSRTTAGNKAVKVVRASDSTSQDIFSLTNGNLDTAAAASFAGTDAICTGTISGTTLSISSCSSGTLHVYDPISGTGIVQPAFITAIGSCATPPGTCTLNASQTVAVGETITAQVALNINTFYDPTGNARDAIAATTFGLLLLNCVNSLPCMIAADSTTQFNYDNSSSPSQAQPLSLSFVAIRSGHFTTAQAAISQQDNFSATMGPVVGWNNAVNQGFIYAGTVRTFTLNDSAWHAVNANFNGASTVVNVDGTEPALAGTVGTTGLVNTAALYFGLQGAGNPMIDARLVEGGFWPVGFSGTQRTNMCHNQFAYWGTATSC